jgi:hypothetical protein
MQPVDTVLQTGWSRPEGLISVADTAGYDEAGRRYVVSVAKITFVWDDAGKATLAKKASQAAVQLQDLLGGRDGTLVLLESDMVPRKERLDVLLAGVISRAEPLRCVSAGLGVGARLRKGVRLFGPRRWERGLSGMRLSEPEPFSELSISWEHAFGGIDPDDPTYWLPTNPVGVGLARRPRTLLGREAPRFEDLRDPRRPIGFGPVGRHWQPRVHWAGTYDQKWLDERFPFLPVDFRPHFFNCAPHDQQLEGGYQAGETVVLIEMGARSRDRFRLPHACLPFELVTKTGASETASLPDTLVIEPQARRFSLVFRRCWPVESVASLLHVRVGPLELSL